MAAAGVYSMGPPQAERDAGHFLGRTAVHILNRLPTKALNGKTSYKACHGRKPAVGYLLTFGCLVFIKELNHVGKLDDRST